MLRVSRNSFAKAWNSESSRRLPILFAVLALTGQPARAEPVLAVGLGECDVSPRLGDGKKVFIAGFGHDRQAQGLHDPIMARAIVLDDGKKKIALASVDVVGLFPDAVAAIRQQLPGYDYILLSATHNHQGPDTLGLWGKTIFTSGLDPDYLRQIEAGVVKAIRRAADSRQTVRARIGSVCAPQLLEDVRLPIVKQDELVVIAFTTSVDNKPHGVLVQWNCHPETLDSKNRQISADFVASTISHLTARQHCPVIYFSGAVGGLMTSLKVKVSGADGKPLEDGTFAKTEAYGRLVADQAEAALKQAPMANLVPFEIRTKSVLVPVDNKVYQLAAQIKVLQRPLYAWEDRGLPAPPPKVDGLPRRPALQTEVGYLRLGELELAAIPGEIYPELVLGKVADPPDPGSDYPKAAIEPAIYAQLKAKHHMIIGLANDEIGYLIPKRQWDEKPPFCYGLKESQYGEINSTSPDAAGIICETFRGLVQGNGKE